MSSRELQHYYDRNTALFLRIGSSAGSHAIHRGLWAPGVRNGREAAEHVNTLLAEGIRANVSGTPRLVLDLGCGVGGTLFSLARAFPEARLHGVTISGNQVAIAQQLAQQQGLQARCSFTRGDFEQLRLERRADAIVAVESLVHVARPERFLATCREHLAPGGVVLIVDDFLAYPVPNGAHAMQRTIDRFRAGWRVPGLCTLETLEAAAAAVGFQRLYARDLSSLIRTSRPRDRLVALVSPPVRLLGLARRPFWANVVGGHALNRAIRKGWIRYRLLALGRPEAGPGMPGGTPPPPGEDPGTPDTDRRP
ncbi:MAG: class I SAM-dependent methyltransferase [Thioalkalivibrio sp.]|nr:MAG: class I SAM-dependent methyltransferase [Thioalkalivibrio sp.]